MDFAVAVPTWGVGTGGTRFARFPGPGEPRHIHDKLEDCGVINQLTPGHAQCLAAFSLGQGERLQCAAPGGGLPRTGFRCGELQHLPGSRRTSSAPTSSARSPMPTRARARRPSSTISNASRSAASLARRRSRCGSPMVRTFPGQSNLNAAFDRYIESLKAIYDALPKDWLRLPRTQALRAGLLFDGDFRLGFELSWRRWSLAPRPSASSISAITRPTPISSRSWRGWSGPRSWPVSTSMIRNMATTISIRAPSIRSACSWSSTNWSMRNCARPKASRPPT